jgi:hypothetical protein
LTFYSPPKVVKEEDKIRGVSEAHFYYIMKYFYDSKIGSKCDVVA